MGEISSAYKKIATYHGFKSIFFEVMKQPPENNVTKSKRVIF